MNPKPLNVLLADDDADDCLFFRNALKELDLPTSFTEVHDGEELMKFLTQEPAALPDVLFLDINMPCKNGLECLSEIKRHEKLKELPVVMFSTSNSQDKINVLFKTGADVYVRKPGNFAQLVQVIHHAIPVALENIFSQGKLKYILNA